VTTRYAYTTSVCGQLFTRCRNDAYSGSTGVNGALWYAAARSTTKTWNYILLRARGGGRLPSNETFLPLYLYPSPTTASPGRFAVSTTARSGRCRVLRQRGGRRAAGLGINGVPSAAENGLLFACSRYLTSRSRERCRRYIHCRANLASSVVRILAMMIFLAEISLQRHRPAGTDRRGTRNDWAIYRANACARSVTFYSAVYI